MTTDWFPGGSGNPAHAAFLAALRTCAQERGLVDASPDHTTPAGLAHHAFGWFEAQLRRPVERHEWTSGDRVTRTEWWCRDPDEQLASARFGWRSRRRTPQPDRVVQLR